MLTVPRGRPIVVQLSSRDVIHSFTLNEMRVKQDATPGMAVVTWFTSTPDRAMEHRMFSALRPRALPDERESDGAITRGLGEVADHRAGARCAIGNDLRERKGVGSTSTVRRTVIFVALSPDTLIIKHMPALLFMTGASPVTLRVLCSWTSGCAN
ncbi:MAG: hypothetical protein LC791_11425 [Acidobacteria bacterium]|nr:hypothetical protein [Acidobacteriota bacterium]